MASASASTFASSSAFPRNYHVFINHRGPDVKKAFASHLYNRLLSHGLQVFLDQPELERGENTPPQIEHAIVTASVHVAIFSPGYAYSEWCLDELVLMLKSGAAIIPVFYKVKPSELRLANKGDDGVYARAMRTYENKSEYHQGNITKWKGALYEVSLISGFELDACNCDEGELVDQIARQVLKTIRKAPLHVATHPTGLDEKLQDFEVILEQQQHRRGPTVVGIVGIGGVGKTTLAKYFFNRKISDYQRSCFLPDVRDAAARRLLPSLQSKLYKDLTGRDQLIDSVDEGIVLLKDRLSCRQGLVVLDDVDNDEQLGALFSPVKGVLPSGSVGALFSPVKGVLPSGSVVLLTSRNKDVLRKSAGVEGSCIYNMTGLSFEHSQELFCSHAFHQRYPPVGYEGLVTSFLDACQGLPLSLKVIGALLHWESTEIWEAELRKLSQVLPREIQSRLKISYDSLDEQEKEIFLNIACFFIGKDRDTAIRAWDESGLEGSLGLRTLESKCLVTLDSENRIRMHDHLRDLGINLAEKEPPGCLRRSETPLSTVPQIFDESFKSEEFSNRDDEMSGLQLLKGPLGELKSIIKEEVSELLDAIESDVSDRFDRFIMECNEALEEESEESEEE